MSRPSPVFLSPILLTALSIATSVLAQTNVTYVGPLLKQSLQSQPVVADQLRHFMLRDVPPLVLPSTAKRWDSQAAGLRAHTLAALYHGWPQAWIDAAPKFEQVGVIEGRGYRIVKLRYEVVPGLTSAALLYEPEHVSGRMPAILNVNGHGDGGKAVEQKQKRCINQARRGILALSIEFVGFGELDAPGNEHNTVGLMELAGANGAGLFYLAMRRGLDYLYADANVDRTRIGVAGLSGGGWQTMLLGSLDPRVGPVAAVAGFSSLTTSIEHPEYHDMEQNAADLRQAVDYAQLDAMRAPRPTLLIYNAMDNCCFRADIVKQGVYLDMKPFYNLYGRPDALEWYLNLDPGTHNFGIDSRQVAYKFFNTAFRLHASATEDADTDAEVRDYDDLVVGLPKDNLTLLALARQLAAPIHHEAPPTPDARWAEAGRTRLAQVVRYTPVTLTHAWPLHATHEQGIESLAYRFEFSNGLCATGVLFGSLTASENEPTTVLVSDAGTAAGTAAGMVATGVDVANLVDRGRRVLALDPLFFGENVPADAFGTTQFTQLLNGMGERPLGLEAAQVTAVVRWLALGLNHGSATPRAGDPALGRAGNPALNRAGDSARSPLLPVPPVQIVTTGVRSETVALVAAALSPELFSSLDARQSIPSFRYAFDHPLIYAEAPELMCQDLYRDFDLNTLSAIASPVKVNLSATAPKRLFWD